MDFAKAAIFPERSRRCSARDTGKLRHTVNDFRPHIRV
jgi:hypothetical protein